MYRAANLPCIGSCDPLIWHLVEARDAAISVRLFQTAESIEQTIGAVLREFNAEYPIQQLRVVGGAD